MNKKKLVFIIAGFVFFLPSHPQITHLASEASSCHSTLKRESIRNQILNEDGSLKPEYITMEGQVRFAEKNTDGQMSRAFRNVSEALDKILFDQLEWKNFTGPVSEYRAYRKKILNKDGTLKPEYISIEGQIRFAEDHTDGLMHRAFIYVSAVLDKVLFDQLEWKVFSGSVSDYHAYREKILNENGSLKSEYQGIEGQARFAEDHTDNQMPKAFMNVSAVLNNTLFKKLKWREFSGSVSEYRAYREKILNEDGNLKPEYITMEGQARFAEDHTDNQMHKAFRNVSAVLDTALFEKLEWKSFSGSASEYRTYKDKILNEDDALKPEYQGMEGLTRFAEKNTDGQMHKAFVNVSVVLDEIRFKRLEWKDFSGSVFEYRAYREKILNEDGSLKPEYQGMEGQARFAEKNTDGQMSRAFKNMSKVLDTALFERLEWMNLQGTSTQFHKLVEDFVENYPQGYQGQKGQKRVADKIFKGHLLRTYENVSLLRGYFFGEKEDRHGKPVKNKEFRSLTWSRK